MHETSKVELSPHFPRNLANTSCPCIYVEPCGPQCSCREPASSAGCRRCCTYGSPEQRVAQARRIVDLMEPRSAFENDALIEVKESMDRLECRYSTRGIEFSLYLKDGRTIDGGCHDLKVMMSPVAQTQPYEEEERIPDQNDWDM